jgi:phosphoribosylformimino-5-aminoimidazole carboxamide ribotide isomerase
MKVIAAVDIMDGSVVRLIKGDPSNKITYSNNPIEIARRWETAGADLLHIVDLDAALSNGNNNSNLIFKILSSVTIPVEVAGGIRAYETAEDILTKASKVVIGTIAYRDPEIIRKLVKKNGKDRIVISIDQRGGMVMVKGWKESTDVKVLDAISKFRAMGIEEFLLTSVERDGTLEGPDLQSLSEAVVSGGKIIASGGISSIEDIIKVKNLGCSSVILGKAMYDGKLTIERAKMVA